MTETKAALAPLFALLIAFSAGGCAWLQKMTSQQPKTGTYKLFSLRVPAAETECISAAQRAYQSCSQITTASEGTTNWGECNGQIAKDLKQCPGMTSHTITQSGTVTEIADRNCVADLPSGTQVYCWTIGLEDEDYFEEGSAMEANLKAP